MLDSILNGDVPSEDAIDAPAVILRTDLLAEIALRVHIDRKNFVPALCQRGSHDCGGRCLCDAALLICNADNLHRFFSSHILVSANFAWLPL